MSIKILKEIKELIKKEFGHVIISDPVIIRRKLRILLDDGSFIEIRYPTVREYSLHWQKGSRIINSRHSAASSKPKIISKTYPF
ncbi:MAG: hypothetical protein ACTSV7_05655 [Candidatus Baldrarchaeia archaeon]